MYFFLFINFFHHSFKTKIIFTCTQGNPYHDCDVLFHRYGPMFGAGADLCISDECSERPESYSNLPHSYDGPQASSSLLMGDYNFTVKDYEVFGLKTEPLYERV